MANYATLKAAIAAAIRENGNKEITGNLLQQQLLAMVNSLGVGYQFAGVATPATNPGTPDQNLFYLATIAGTYTNFDGIVIGENEACILKYNGSWEKLTSGFATSEMIDALAQKLSKVTGILDDGTTYNIKDTATYRVCAYYDIPDVNGLYHLKVSNLVFSEENALYLAIRSAKTPYSATVLAYIGAGDYTTDVDIYFTIPDNVKANAKYIGVTQGTADGTASFDVELSYIGNDVINAKIDESLNNISIVRTFGNGVTNQLLNFKTVVGCKYVVMFPRTWTADFTSDSTLRIFDVRKTDNTVVVGTEINKSGLATRNDHIEFVADESEYNMFVRADIGQQLLFVVMSVGDYTEIAATKQLALKNSQLINYIDDGEKTYNEKYVTPGGVATNRTCVFYPIGDVNATFGIKVTDITLPTGNAIKIIVASEQSPYSAAQKFLVATLTTNADYTGQFSIPENVKANAKYIAVCQVDADASLCQFNVELYQTDSLMFAVDSINEKMKDVVLIDDGSTYNQKFVMPWGSATNRTCVFYPLQGLDVNRSFYVKVYNATIPASANDVRVIVTKDMSPYDSNPAGNVLQLVGYIEQTGDIFEQKFVLNENAKTDGKYIGICQSSADTDLCQFDVRFGYGDCIEKTVEDLEKIADDKLGLTKDIIPYNDTVFANGRTLKIYNPYKNGGNNQYAGQLHCHSWNYEEYNGTLYKVPIGYTVQQIAAMSPSERSAAIESVNQQFVQAHKTVGYSFMTITNYDNFSDYSVAPSVLPAAFLWIGNGYEANTGGWDNTGQGVNLGAHLNVINTNFGKQFRDWLPKDIVDYCEARNCFVIYNHPFLSALYSNPAFVKQITNKLRFIEVYNGLSVHHSDLAQDVPFIKPGIMLDEDFDALISQGNFTFAVATSDERILNTSMPDLRWGCVKVFANELTHKAIFDALMSGNFYATSFLDDNVKINGVAIEDGKYKVDVGIENIVVEFLGKDNTILSTVTTSSGNTVAAYDIIGTEPFVRARLYKLNSEPYDASAWHKNKEWIIWTQPIFISKTIIDN